MLLLSTQAAPPSLVSTSFPTPLPISLPNHHWPITLLSLVQTAPVASKAGHRLGAARGEAGRPRSSLLGLEGKRSCRAGGGHPLPLCVQKGCLCGLSLDTYPSPT